MEVLLHIGDKQFVMNISEALSVCDTLNACNQLGREWTSVHGNNVLLFMKPDIKAAFITPITALTRLEAETNMKEVAEKKK